MLNITQILFAVNVIIFCLNVVLNGIQNGIFIDAGIIRGFLLGILILVFLNLGVLIYIFKMGRAINRGDGYCFGEKYTRILLPSFVFIVIADVFFTVVSIFQGGIFRGWLTKK